MSDRSIFDHISAAVTLTDLTALAAEAAAYAVWARAAATLRAYRADWRDFADWRQERQTSAPPAVPDTVALYITDLARTRAVSTIRRWLASIAQAHCAQGLESPTGAPVVRQALRGIRRAKGVAPRQDDPAGRLSSQRPQAWQTFSDWFGLPVRLDSGFDRHETGRVAPAPVALFTPSFGSRIAAPATKLAGGRPGSGVGSGWMDLFIASGQ